MAIQQKTYTSEEFWEFVNRPENQNKFFERRNGEIIEMSPASIYSSVIGSRINYFLMAFILDKNLGHVSGEQGGYNLPDETTYAPDVAFISAEHQQDIPPTGFNPSAPDLAVEVISPGNSASEIHQKVLDYLAAGTRIVWVVYPKTKTVDVHTSDGARTLKITDTLDGGDVLPGFTLPVRDIFPKQA